MAVKLASMKAPGENTGVEALPDPLYESGDTADTPPSEDIEQIRWALSQTLDERLATLQDFVDTFWTPAHG
jgi:hypothetical protein